MEDLGSQDAIGKITPRIVLDHPDRIYSGAEIVTGHLILEYQAASTSTVEFFGPLSASIVFLGYSKAEILRLDPSRNKQPVNPGEHVQLFSQSSEIFNRPIRLRHEEYQKFPFKVQFPERTAVSATQIWNTDGRGCFHHEPCQTLPPSLRYSCSGFTAAVKYRISCGRISSPGIKLDVSKVRDVGAPLVRYEPDALPDTPFNRMAFTTTQPKLVSNKSLACPTDKPSYLKRKFQPHLCQYPSYRFSVTLTSPQYCSLTRPIVCEVRIRPETDGTDSVVVPAITISDFAISLRVYTQVRHQPIANDPFPNWRLSHEDYKRDFHGTAHPAGPFSEHQGWSKKVTTAPIIGPPCTFKSHNICRTYTATMRCRLNVAGETRAVMETFEMCIIPRSDNALMSSGRLGLNAPRFSVDDSLSGDQLPAYEEAPPSYAFSNPIPVDMGTLEVH